MSRFFAYTTADPDCIWGIGYSPESAYKDAQRYAGREVEGIALPMSEGAYNRVKRDGFHAGKRPNWITQDDDGKWVLIRTIVVADVPQGYHHEGSLASIGAKAIGRSIEGEYIGPRGGRYLKWGKSAFEREQLAAIASNIKERRDA